MPNLFDSELVAEATRKLPANRWYERRAKARSSCQCDLCVAMRTEVDWKDMLTLLPSLDEKTKLWLKAMAKTVCDRCHSKSQYRYCVPMVPQVVREFFGVRNLCW